MKWNSVVLRPVATVMQAYRQHFASATTNSMALHVVQFVPGTARNFVVNCQQRIESGGGRARRCTNGQSKMPTTVSITKSIYGAVKDRKTRTTTMKRKRKTNSMWRRCRKLTLLHSIGTINAVFTHSITTLNGRDRHLLFPSPFPISHLSHTLSRPNYSIEMVNATQT